MTPVVDMGAFFAEIDQIPQPKAPSIAGSDLSEQVADNFLRLVRQQTETRLLNTQALIEYGFLKARLISSAAEVNKFFELDDQIIVQEYQFCTSLSYHKRVFVMEFRQVSGETEQCNHALELIFRSSSGNVNNGGHSTLILARENRQFVWRQLQARSSGPSGTSRMLVGLILRWLQHESGLKY